MIHALVLIVIAGMLVWFVNTYIAMAPMFKSAFNIIVAVLVLIYLLNFFGIDTGYHFPVR